jgi:serine phosphatase RsbU (regulator of sigma subunit)
LSLIASAVSGQKRYNRDSLLAIYKDTKQTDTVRAGSLHYLATDLSANNTDSALKVLDELEKFATEKNNELFIGLAHQARGIIYKNTGKYSLAIASYFQCIAFWKNGAVPDSSIGQVHQNMANVYGRLHQPEKAQVHYDTALSIYTRTTTEGPIGSLYNDMGNMYMEHDLDLSLKYLRKSLEIRTRLGNERGIAFTSGNISGVFIFKREPDSVLKYAKPYYDYAVKYKRTGLFISSLTTIGGAYLLKEDYRQGRDSCLRAYLLNENNQKNLEHRQNSCECLYEAYMGLKKTDSALKYYQLFIVSRDSLRSQDQRDEVTRLEYEFQYANKVEADSLQNVQKMEVINAKSEGEKKLRYALFAGLGLTAVFGFVMFNRFRTTQKQKNVIATQQAETEAQKKVIEEKNKEITDSINYAQRIQQAVLPPETELKKAFADVFVLFKPRDIVSGDFYWYDESRNNKVIALADCTGHGVPGGFMSMLGYEILQDVVMLEEIRTTSEALRRLDQKVTMTLNKNDKAYRDGMDMALCAFSKHKMEMLYSGANRPLLHFSNGVMNTIKPDKHTIGGAIDNVVKDFAMHTVRLQKGDMIYLFTDGYADQFGGPDGKKFMSKKLESLLASIAALSCSEQKSKLESAFSEWKGSLDQVDDVCIVGIRI